MSRPRLSSATDELLEELDSLMAENDMEDTTAELEPLKGRGDSDRNFTKDSVIKHLLEKEVRAQKIIKGVRKYDFNEP